MIQAAFVKEEYTPAPGTRFGRLGINILKAEGVKWPLFARLSLFDDGRQRAALLVLDQGFLVAPVVAEFRRAITERTGIPSENIMVACTHTHNAPPMNPWLPPDPGFDFVDKISVKLATLAEKAVAGLKPVRLKADRIDAPGWSGNRRPIYRAPDGREQVGTHGPRSGDDFVRMEGPDESDLLALLASDAEDKTAGGIVNFACHSTTMYNVPLFSPDYPGPLLESLESQYGGTFLFVNGFAGNLGPEGSGFTRGSGITDPAARASAMGQGLARQAATAIDRAGPVAEGRIRVAREILSIPQRRVTGKQVEIAREYQETFPKGAWSKCLSRELYGCEYHFHHRSPAVDDWLARDILGMWEWQRRVGTRDLVEAIEIQAIALGDIAFVGLPAEMFSEFAQILREKSPFPRTFIIELANGWHGYIPTEEALRRGGYETCFALQSRLVPNAGTLMTGAALRLLSQLTAR